MPMLLPRALPLLATGCLLLGCGGGGLPAPDPSGLTQAPPPSAQIASNNMVGLGDFTAQGSDPSGLPVTYAWDFDDDGVTDSTATSPNMVNWTTPGTKPITLVVTNSLGQSSSAQASHMHSTDLPMPASGTVRAFTLVGEPDTEFAFQAVFLDLVDGMLRFAAPYEWDFEDDGVVDRVTPAPFATHVYGSRGAKRCRVRATNGDGVVGEATVTVSVCREGSLGATPPGVMIGGRHAEPRASRFLPVAGGRLGPLRLTAYGGDPDGGPVTIRWDLDADGVFDDASGRHADLPVTGEFLGEVRVRMTDDEGQTTESLATLRVEPILYSAPASPRPLLIESEATAVAPGTTVSFRVDFGGDLAWDFDGDGLTDLTGSRGTWRFDQPGMYMPEVRRTDPDGNVSRAWMTLVVESCQDETAAPRFFCRAPDTFLLHGGVAEVALSCDAGPEPGFADAVAVGGPPTSYPGGFGLPVPGDPGGLGLEVVGPSGRVFVPPPVVPTPRTALPLGFAVTSTAVDGPARTIPYAVTLRLEDPGARLQVLKALVTVRHEWLFPVFGWTGGAGDYVGALSFPPPDDDGPPIAPIHEIEMRFEDQVPPWSGVGAVSGLPDGWTAVVDGKALHLVLDPANGLPVGPGGPAFDPELDFTTADLQTPPSHVELRLLGAEGDLIGREEAVIP